MAVDWHRIAPVSAPSRDEDGVVEWNVDATSKIGIGWRRRSARSRRRILPVRAPLSIGAFSDVAALRVCTWNARASLHGGPRIHRRKVSALRGVMAQCEIVGLQEVHMISPRARAVVAGLAVVHDFA